MQILTLDETLITEPLLAQQQQGEEAVRLVPGAIITPSARDYLRLHSVVVVEEGASASPGPGGTGNAGQAGYAGQSGGTSIQEILPPGAEGGLLYHGRCDHPDRAYGCRDEEFGSGFVEPACCDACAKAGRNGAPGCDCENCSVPGNDAELESLVQRLTDEIMSRLEQ